MNRNTFLHTVSLTLAALALGLVVFFQSQRLRVALVDNSELIQSYQGTLDIQKFSTVSQQQDQFLLDSLQLHLKSEYQLLIAAEQSVSQAEFQQKKQAFLILKDRYNRITEQSHQATTEREQQEYSQISTQLNAYVLEYGKAQGYDYILGANGTGNIWYVGEAKDITDEVLQFVNDRYAGK